MSKRNEGMKIFDGSAKPKEQGVAEAYAE